MSDKLLTLIVPSYNMERYLAKCLDSLIVDDGELRQRLDVVVVNDGSKDRTSEIAHSYEAKYPGVFRVVDKPNGHYGSCVNAGLDVALGLYVKVLDADDWFDTAALAKYLQLLAEHTGDRKVDLVINDFIYLSEKVTFRRSYPFVGAKDFELSKFDFSDRFNLWMHGVAYLTDNLRRIGYRQMTGITHTDLQWLQTPMTTVKKTAYFGEALYIYNVDREGNSCGGDSYYGTFHERVAVVRKILEDFAQTAPSSVTPAQYAYLKNLLRFHVLRIYAVYLTERSTRLRSGVIEEFDAFLAKASLWLYEETAELTVGNRWKIRYVSEWRRRHRLSLKLRAYLFVRNAYERLRKMFVRGF